MKKQVLVLLIVYTSILITQCDSTTWSNTSHVRFPRRTNGCILPHHPTFGKWIIYEYGETATYPSPGDTIPLNTVLQVSCRPTYKLEGDAALVCIRGKWTNKIGKCLRTCPSLFTTPVMTVTCTYNGRDLDDCVDAVDQTKAKFECADFYEDESLQKRPIHICYNGKWSNKIPECTPICGLKATTQSPTLIVGGVNVTRGSYPWQIALYNETDKELLCGGTMLNQKVFLTAAHCVTNSDGKLHPAKIYTVAVGKYFRQYDHPLDFNDVQFSGVHKMFVPKKYKADIQNYFGDIAIIITKKTFKLSQRVQPVCVDWGLRHDAILLNPQREEHSYVAGWGFTVEHKNPSTVLKEIEAPIISDEKCEDEMNEDYKKYLTDDKFCAGFLEYGTAVCKGDSGGGLVAKYGEKFFVIGVVSLSPQAPTAEGGCDSQQYALYTKVSYYIENFIVDYEALFRPTLSEDMDCDEYPNCISTDTVTSTTTTPTVIIRGRCTLPQYPSFGKWKVLDSTNQFSPNMSVPTRTTIQISCDEGYKLHGNDSSTCLNSIWNSELGDCLKPCSSLANTISTEITCTFKNNELNDCTEPLEGTIARYRCAPFYESVESSKNPFRVCRNGTWDLEQAECVPICGQKQVSVQPLIVHGEIAPKNAYPWMVGLYQNSNKEFFCGGTLISPSVILTVAHCVTDFDGKARSPNYFSIAAGKHYRIYNHLQESYMQAAKIKNIFLPLQWSGRQNYYLGDIAIIVTQKPFILSVAVQPACVDWSTGFSKNIENQLGLIHGWGFTESDSKPSEELQSLEVPIESLKMCLNVIKNDFKQFFVSDKFCAGYHGQNKSACNGDSGSGLFLKHNGRYYIVGILSLAPSGEMGGCDPSQYALYTRISNYTSLIVEKEAESKTLDNECTTNDECKTTTPKPTPVEPTLNISCTLPQHPSHGKWTVFSYFGKLKPGDTVARSTVLRVSCYQKYKLEGDSALLCENGKWSSTIGKCRKTCWSVHSTSTMKAVCILNGKQTENCTDPIDGTQVKYECAPFYEDPELAQNPVRLCSEGLWDYPPPICKPVCGQKSVKPQILIINGNTVKKGDYPWHAAIYKKQDSDYINICGGTIISIKLIVTAAHCVTNNRGVVEPIEGYIVAVGKFYRNYKDSRDGNMVQYSALQEIIVHPYYKGVTHSYGANIAILVIKEALILSLQVQPLCLDWNLTYQKDIDKAQDITGYVTGWGFTKESSSPSDQLQEIQVPIVSNEVCERELPEDFLTYFTYDKMCAGILNNGTSVCKGDSGGALAIPFNGKYYFAGIVAVAPPAPTAAGGCNSQTYTLYEKISTFVQTFIPETFDKYNI